MSKCNLRKFPKLCSITSRFVVFHSLAPGCIISTRESNYSMGLAIWVRMPEDTSGLCTWVCLCWAGVHSRELHVQKNLPVQVIRCLGLWVCKCPCVRTYTCVSKCVRVSFQSSRQICNNEGDSGERLCTAARCQQPAVLRVLRIPYIFPSKSQGIAYKDSRMNLQRTVLSLN